MAVAQVSAWAPSDTFNGRRKFPVLGFKVIDGEVSTVPGIDIDHYQATLGTRQNADVGLGSLGPPACDQVGISGRCRGPVLDTRMLPDIFPAVLATRTPLANGMIERKDKPASFCRVER
jgi:hypothetical protein